MKPLKRLLAEHNSAEYIASILLFAVASLLPKPIFEMSEPTLIEFLSALAAISGTVMATVTFVCALLYQSITPRTKRLIELHGRQVTKSWISIITTSLLVSATAILLITFSKYTFWISNIAISLLLLVFLLGVRAIWWLHVLLTLNSIDATRAEPVRFKIT